MFNKINKGKQNKVLRNCALITSVLAVGGVGFLCLEEAERRLRGVCGEFARPLSMKEKQQRLTEQIDWYVRKNNSVLPRSNIVAPRDIHLLNFEHAAFRDNPARQPDFNGTYNATIKINIDGSALYIKFFPDVPDIELDSNHRLIDYKGGLIWKNVSNWQKISGYSFDYVFVDLTISVSPGAGPIFDYRSQWRAWTNACGEFVKTPDEFEVG